jgi:hypothetical protein
MINYVVFKYVSKFSSKYTSAHAWPTIELADRSFNPILKWHEVSARKSMGDELTQLPMTQLPNRLILNTTIRPYRSAVNSHGDVLVENDFHSIKLINKKGKSKVINLPSPRGNVDGKIIDALAVDNDDNVYVVRRLETHTENGDVRSYVLDVLDENYNVKQDSRRLEFLKATYWDFSDVEIAINKNNDIIMTTYSDPQVYICDNTGKLTHKFERSSRSGFIQKLGIITTGQDEIMISSKNYQAVSVDIYSEKGNLKSTIKLPEGHEAEGLAFQYVICKIIILTSVERKFALLCYTEAGELETTSFFGKTDEFQIPNIKSHPCGPIAVIDQKSITFI